MRPLNNLKQYWLIIVALVMAIFFRGWAVTSAPPSPYWEEAALGYDAYSLLLTGLDHHGRPWPVVALESFGDYKPTGYVYALIPFISLFGLSTWVVRLPSIVAGVSIVIGVGVIAAQLVDVKKRGLAAGVGMMVAALSPWAILFSRAGWEVNLATACITWAMVCGVVVARAKSFSKHIAAALVMTAVLLWGAFYTYHAARVIAPFLGVVLLGFWLHQWLSTKKTSVWRSPVWLVTMLLAGIISLIALAPFAQSLGSPELNQRFAETSIFADPKVILESNAHQDGSMLNKLLYHRYFLFVREITANYLSHFRFDYLFVSGDSNVRHSLQYQGLLYYLDAVWFLVGGWWLVKQWRKEHWLLVIWAGISLFPAALTLAVPHALRTLSAMPVVMVILSVGYIAAWDWLQSKVVPFLANRVKTNLAKGVVAVMMAGVMIVSMLQLVGWWRFYLRIYPTLYASDWQYGYQQLYQQLAEHQRAYPNVPIYVAREQGRPAMYLWFFTKTDPRRVQAAQATAKKDQGEFLEFENWRFVRGTSEVTMPGIVAASPEQMDALAARQIVKQLSTVQLPDGKTIWVIAAVE